MHSIARDHNIKLAGKIYTNIEIIIAKALINYAKLHQD